MGDSSIGTAELPARPGRPELLVVGAASRDIDATDARGWRLGGTVSYAALTCARLGLRVRALIGADELAAAADELDDLRAAGVDVRVVPLASGPVFENRHVDNVRVQHVHAVSDALPAAALPVEWRASTAVLLGPVAGELRDEWATALPNDCFAALAWQGLLRELVPGGPVEMQPLTATLLVRRANVIFVSAEDVAGGGPPLSDLIRDDQELFVTHGDKGALHFRPAAGARRVRFMPPLPPRRAIDTTGAGDVFLAAYLAARLVAPQLAATADDWRLDAIAAAAASLNVAVSSLRDVPGVRDLCEALLTRQA